jgi:hypothetical protein
VYLKRILVYIRLWCVYIMNWLESSCRGTLSSFYRCLTAPPRLTWDELPPPSTSAAAPSAAPSTGWRRGPRAPIRVHELPPPAQSATPYVHELPPSQSVAPSRSCRRPRASRRVRAAVPEQSAARPRADEPTPSRKVSSSNLSVALVYAHSFMI